MRGFDLIKESLYKREKNYVVLVEDTAYHGSPYNFDKFDTKFIGKGQGAQSHGWGLYFALEARTGEGYQQTYGYNHTDSDRYYEYNGKKFARGTILYNVINLMKEDNSRYNKYDKNDAVRYIDKLANGEYVNNQKFQDALPYLRKFIDNVDVNDIRMHARLYMGQIYTVEIPSLEYYLDEEALLTRQNSFIKDKIKEIKNEITGLLKPGEYDDRHQNYRVGDVNTDLNKMIGESFYRGLKGCIINDKPLKSDKDVSLYLLSKGIMGIKYDGYTDGHCAVVFDGSMVKIVEKKMEYNGETEEGNMDIPTMEKIADNPLSITKMDNVNDQMIRFALSKVDNVKNMEEIIQALGEKNELTDSIVKMITDAGYITIGRLKHLLPDYDFSKIEDTSNMSLTAFVASVLLQPISSRNKTLFKQKLKDATEEDWQNLYMAIGNYRFETPVTVKSFNFNRDEKDKDILKAIYKSVSKTSIYNSYDKMKTILFKFCRFENLELPNDEITTIYYMWEMPTNAISNIPVNAQNAKLLRHILVESADENYFNTRNFSPTEFNENSDVKECEKISIDLMNTNNDADGSTFAYVNPQISSLAYNKELAAHDLYFYVNILNDKHLDMNDKKYIEAVEYSVSQPRTLEKIINDMSGYGRINYLNYPIFNNINDESKRRIATTFNLLPKRYENRILNFPQYINFMDDKNKKELLKKDIKYARYMVLDKNLQMQMIKKNPFNIRWIENPLPEVIEKAKSMNPDIENYIRN